MSKKHQHEWRLASAPLPVRRGMTFKMKKIPEMWWFWMLSGALIMFLFMLWWIPRTDLINMQHYTKECVKVGVFDEVHSFCDEPIEATNPQKERKVNR